MAEYNVHHDVRQLMKLFDLQDDGAELSESKIAEQFLKSTGQPRSQMGDVLRRIQTKSGSDFKRQYEELKSKNVMELDPMIALLDKVMGNSDVKNYLRLHKTIAEKRRVKHMAGSRTPQPLPSATVSDSGITNRAASNTSYVTDGGTPISSKPLYSPTSTDGRMLVGNASSDTLDITPNQSANVSGTSHRSSKDTSAEKKRHRKGGDWEFLSFDFNAIDWKNENEVPPLSSLDVITQESVLIQDLLHVLMGIEGLYIRLGSTKGKKDKKSLLVDPGADSLLYTLSTKILTICPLYSYVIFFIDHKDKHGLVNQALGAAMREVVKDYFTSVANLELLNQTSGLTMHKMWLDLNEQDFFTNFQILRYFSSTIHSANAIGGASLSILHNKTISYIGNQKAQQFCLKITSQACVPYFEILEKWITKGIIHDPKNEFFIEDVMTQRKIQLDRSDDYYWEDRYKVHTSRMPVFLSRFQEKILNTGKYLSVMRDCGKEIVMPKREPLSYTIEERFYVEKIESCYLSASKHLLHLLMEESDLIGHLISVKHYFFMDQGDFIVQFIDTAEEELAKDITEIVLNRLTSLLELAIRTSSMNSDQHKDEISLQLLHDELLTQLSSILSMGSSSVTNVQAEEPRTLKGYESIAFDYKVQWPLTLILSRRTIACYQMLSRHLFYCKYIERQLGNVWKDNKIVKSYHGKSGSLYAEAFALTQKMLNFVQNLSYYMMVEVIEPNFHNFIEKIKAMSTVDEISRAHTSFVEGCLTDCMLNQKAVLQNMMLLLQQCMRFSETMQQNYHDALIYETQKDITMPSRPTIIHEDDEQAASEPLSFEQRIRLAHTEFNYTLHCLLQEIANLQQDHCTGNILHVLNRLDFNEFYKRMFDESDGSFTQEPTEDNFNF